MTDPNQTDPTAPDQTEPAGDPEISAVVVEIQLPTDSGPTANPEAEAAAVTAEVESVTFSAPDSEPDPNA